MAAMLRERVEGFAPDDAAVAAALRRGRPEAAVAALLLEPVARTRAPTRAEPYFRDAGRVLVARGSDVQYVDAATGYVLSRYDAGGDVTCVAPSPVDRLTFAAATARGAIHRVRVHHDPG